MIDPAPIMEWVSNQGFAIAVAAYLLLRLEQKIDRLIGLVERVLASPA